MDLSLYEKRIVHSRAARALAFLPETVYTHGKVYRRREVFDGDKGRGQ
jgi:hypothetical protein